MRPPAASAPATGGGVDAACQTADDRQPGLREASGQPFGLPQPIAGGVSRADDADRHSVVGPQFTANKEHARRIVDRFELLGIVRLRRHDQPNAVLPADLQRSRDIDLPAVTIAWLIFVNPGARRS